MWATSPDYVGKVARILARRNPRTVLLALSVLEFRFAGIGRVDAARGDSAAPTITV